MKSLLPLLMVLSTGCSTYQYVTLDSSLPRDSTYAFAFENDTLYAAYGAAGEGGMFWVEITNKPDAPLYVDWQQSALIEDMPDGRQIAHAYWGQSDELVAALAAAAGTPGGRDAVTTVLPQTTVVRPLRRISTEFFELADGEGKQIKLDAAGRQGRAYVFDPADAPLRFRSLLNPVRYV